MHFIKTLNFEALKSRVQRVSLEGYLAIPNSFQTVFLPLSPLLIKMHLGAWVFTEVLKGIDGGCGRPNSAL